MTTTERNSRQESLVPGEGLAEAHCVVIGVGAVGRQVAMQLAAMGVKRLDLYDFDTIEVVNLAPQSWPPSRLGEYKVEVVAEQCKELNPDMVVNAYRQRFARSDYDAIKDAYVFACVDTMNGRKLIYDAVLKADGVKFLGDTRVASETARVISVGPEEIKKYLDSLFSDQQAEVGACTAKMTVYMASLAASIVVSRFAQNLRGMGYWNDHLISLLASEMGPT